MVSRIAEICGDTHSNVVTLSQVVTGAFLRTLLCSVCCTTRAGELLRNSFMACPLRNVNSGEENPLTLIRAQSDTIRHKSDTDPTLFRHYSTQIRRYSDTIPTAIRHNPTLFDANPTQNPKKTTQNRKFHLNTFFLNNCHWVPDSCHREEGKSSREVFEKVRVNAVFVGISGFWVGFSASVSLSLSTLPDNNITGGFLLLRRTEQFILDCQHLSKHYQLKCQCLRLP